MAHYSHEELQKLKSISIVDYIFTVGLGELKKQGANYYRFYFNGHDSIVIDAQKNAFFHNSEGVSGDILRFVEYFENKTFPQALETLAQYANLERSEEEIQAVRRQKNEDFYLPRYIKSSKWLGQTTKEYLINDRKIDFDVVNDLRRGGYLKEDFRNNLYFLWKENGRSDDKVVGASEQMITQEIEPGTNFRGKVILKNSEHYSGFNVTKGNPEKLYFFESPIDLLSYLSIHPDIQNARFCSLEGVKELTLFNMIQDTYRAFNIVPKEVVVGFDNDKSGISLWQNLGREITLAQDLGKIKISNEIPNYYCLPENQIAIYEEVANAHQLDWKDLALIHVFETNARLQTKPTNRDDVALYFGKKDVHNLYNLEMLKKLSHRLARKIEASGGFNPFLEDYINQSVSPERTSRILNELKADFKANRFYAVKETLVNVKDWNDLLKKQGGKLLQASRDLPIEKESIKPKIKEITLKKHVDEQER